ncbi:MAG: hypothetical protein HS114_00900 [Anaerolineales bacterium]|nr:hypothetical protein [Anaerolineales bacterium]
MKWRLHSHKVILLVGDAPPHGVGTWYGEDKEDNSDHWPKGCPCSLTIEDIKSQAHEKGIIIYAVGVGELDWMIRSFTDIAQGVSGEFVSLTNVDSLIDKILPLLQKELVKVAQDIETASWLSSGYSLLEMADASSKTTKEIEESVERLRKKGITLSTEIRTELEAMAIKHAPTPKSQPRIKLGTPSNSNPHKSGRIKLK